MYSQLRENFWNRIYVKSRELNTNSNCENIPTGSGTLPVWDLSRIELQDQRRTQITDIPTIDLEEEDGGNVCFPTSTTHTPRAHMIPTNAQRPTEATENYPGHRITHEHRGLFIPRTAHEITTAPAGIIFNRVYNKKPISPKENYFSVLDTPPTPGVLSAAAIFGEKSVNTDPKPVRTTNQNETQLIRRSFDKTTPSVPDRVRRQEKRNGPYKLLGVIDLEPDDDSSDAADNLDKPSTAKGSPSVSMSPKPDVLTSTNSALVGSSSTPLSSKLCGGKEMTEKNKILTIEIDEDDEVMNEDESKMELSDEDEADGCSDVSKEPVAGTSNKIPADESQVEQCSLSDSETSSTAQMNPSSLANSFWDVSSSGCVKKSSDNISSANPTKKHNDFDLLLDKINQQVPAMSQQDRVEYWRVTREDLLYSIPSNAEIESNASVKRPLDDPIHISSTESSDSETSDSPSLLLLKQQRATRKKRRTGAENGDRSPSSLHLSSEDLDFRKSQVNPEIDKPGSMIQVRKNYHKFPSRLSRSQDDPSSTSKCIDDPYSNFLNDDSKEKEVFEKYLRRNPAYRPNLLKHRGEPTINENKVAVVVLSAIKDPPSIASNVNNISVRRQSERSESTERVPKYGKNRKKSAGKTVRYRVRKKQLKKKSIMIVPSNLRSYRRLVMKSSLRNGKERKKASFVNLLSSAEQKRRKRNANQTVRPKLAPQKQEEPLVDSKPTRENEPVQSSRMSVDSAVSSSTSADHKRCDGFVEDELVPQPVASDLLTMRNPLSRSNGEVLMAFYVSGKLIVVQQEMVSFWECSRLTAMLGLKQDLQLVGQTKRAQRDSQVDPTNTNRLGLNEDEPFYLEPRARNLDEDEARACPLASIYINCYFAGTSDVDEEDGQCVQMKSLQLDTVRSKLSDILFVPLPRSRYFMMCWYEQLSEVEHRTGLCKYSLTPDLETLASIREFPTMISKLTSLKCLDNDRLIGLGSTTIAIWNHDNGCLLFTVDLKMELHISLTSFIRTENIESALFLVQMCPSPGGNSKRKLIKVLGINMSKRSWHLIHSYEVLLESSSILCESSALNSTSLHCTSFQSGELLAICLDDLTTYFTNHKQLQSSDGKRITRDNVATREKIFLNSAENRQLVLISDKLVKLKSIEEYLLLHR
ncbi:uncharacterized protein LOC129777518 [Toxorhynchites rutilus septentrionalis]|uniref:uncharacterized protein LOC129777518 n=1 Tax=Toxorhynchites rutilus septentrionalis TaxID=329112 RepID=UPI00247ADA56|nr:uncharacterized protein LOC129777518 [Toxorhynchites rutilus septentrionalis]